MRQLNAYVGLDQREREAPGPGHMQHQPGEAMATWRNALLVRPVAHAVAMRRHGGVDADPVDRKIGSAAIHHLDGEKLADLELSWLPAISDLEPRVPEMLKGLHLAATGTARERGPDARQRGQQQHGQRAPHCPACPPSGQAASRSALRKAMLSATSPGSSESQAWVNVACSTT